MGHRRYTPAERGRLVAAYREGDLTQREFAKRHRVNLSTLQSWLYKGIRVAEVQQQVDFVRVEQVVEQHAAAGAGVTVAVGDATVRFEQQPDAGYLATLLRQLAC